MVQITAIFHEILVCAIIFVSVHTLENNEINKLETSDDVNLASYNGDFDPDTWTNRYSRKRPVKGTKTKAPKIKKTKPAFNKKKKLFEDVSCGINTNSHKRIRNGTEVRRGEFPWLVRLGSSSDETLCGGTIISREFVLTAAHCTYRKNTGDSLKYIVAGELDIPTKDTDSKKILISRIMRHDDADLALVQVKKPFDWSQNVKPICMPTPDKHPKLEVGTVLTVAGWGATENRDGQFIYPTRSRFMEVPVIDLDVCKRAFEPIGLLHSEGEFCAGKHNERDELESDSCKGDSGGPASLNVDNRWTLYGVIESGDVSCLYKYGIYVEVSKYIHWIREMTQCGSTPARNPLKGHMASSG